MRLAREAICLEGNAGCGKTTCGQLLSHSTDSILLPEYTETLDEAQRRFLMDGFTRRTDADESSIWHCAEDHRSRRWAKGNARHAVLDTSLVSVVAFGLARIQFGQGGNISSTVQRYLKLLSDGDVVVPTRIVHLSTSETVRQRRLQKRGACHPFLLRHDVSEYLDKARLDFYEHYLPQDCWTTVDTSDATPDEALARVVHALESMNPRQNAHAFIAWLGALSF